MAQRKSDTSRANGSKSRGPKTDAGKAKSSRNALAHGLTANFIVLDNESQDDFELFLRSYVERFDPGDQVELELVRTMAVTRWRLRRVANLETALMVNQLELCTDEIEETFEWLDPENRRAYAFEKMAEGKGLSLLIRYEASLTRVYERAAKDLAGLQNHPRRNEPTERLSCDPPPTSLQVEPSNALSDDRASSESAADGRGATAKERVPPQFSEGFSARSMTKIFTGPFCESSFKPSCS
jgi:hypothetical protein